MSQSLQTNGGDTLDAFVTGFELADEDKSWSGLVGALIFSVWVRDKNGVIKEVPHEIAKVANIPLSLRKEITEIVEGQPVLKQSIYGKVAIIDGQDVSARAKRLTHAILVDWRSDRSADSCIIDEEWFESQVL